ncbi:MAG: helix-turn-helix domain-containing protein [Angustibacter sp.]
MVRKVAKKSPRTSGTAVPSAPRSKRKKAGRPRGEVPATSPARTPRKGFLTGRKAEDIAQTQTPILWTAEQVQEAQTAQIAAYAAGVNLPTLHERSPAAGVMSPHPMSGSTGLPTPAGKKQSVTSAVLVRALGRGVWRRRWELTPVAAAAGVAAWSATDPGAAALACAVLGGCAHASAHYLPERIAGRVWLSAKERTMIASWAAGATIWSAAASAGWVTPNPAGVLALSALTGAQTVAWMKSRRIRPDQTPQAGPVMSEQAAALIAAWPWTVALKAPDPLLGSFIDPASMSEPALGAYAFQVELRTDVHAETATGNEIRCYLERALRLPVGTVQIQIDRDDCARLSVTMTPARHLETADAPWPGPVLTDQGTMPVALTPAGEQVAIELHNSSGIRHLTLIGSSGAGKSVAAAALMLPGPLAGREVIFFMDGKRGTSSPRTARALDMVAVTEDQWAAAVRIVHRIMTDRQVRYGRAGIDEYNALTSPDPIITLWIDEATGVRNSLEEPLIKLVTAMLREGRSLGVRVVQCVQRPQFDSYVGGIAARELMMGSAGATVALKPGGSSSGDLTLDGTSESIDLASLPDGGGWCAILQSSKVLAPAARMYHATAERVAAELEGFTAQSLTGFDLAAAGKEYVTRLTGAAWIEQMATARAQLAAGIHPSSGTTVPVAAPIQDTPEWTSKPSAPATGQVEESTPAVPSSCPQLASFASASQKAAAAQAALNRATVLGALRATPTGMTRQDIATATGLPKSTVRRALFTLRTDGEATTIPSTEPEQWKPLAGSQQSAA